MLIDHFHEDKLYFSIGEVATMFNVKERGYTLDGAKKKLKYNKDDVGRDAEIVASLQKIRSFLMEISNEL